MVINRRDIKRKRKDNTACALLDDSPKRTKVHAQRKFAQGSNVSSPVITPVKEIEKQEKAKPDVLPEPQDLLPMNRPHTEDFLTFLCFRGTSMLPPNLNFFNAAPIDSREHTQPLKKEPMNVCPPIASISTRTTPGTSERPFIAFGVRKRADPVLVTKHMDKKRRHALALQALRRKYQEQKMAKIRAVTISKLSEKITSKTVVRTTRSVTKTETVTKKTLPQKTRVKIVTTKRVKVTTRGSIKTLKAPLRPTLKAPLRPTLKAPMRTHLQKRMCLRSFRGRFIQQELTMKKPKKKKAAKIIKKMQEAKADSKKKKETSSEFSSDDDQPLVKTVKVVKPSSKVPLPKIAKKSVANSKKPVEISFRVTRSHPLLASRDSTIKRKIQLARSALQSKAAFVKMAPPKNLSPKQKPKLKEEKENSRVLRADRAEAKEEKSFSPRTRRVEEEKAKKEAVKRIGKDVRKPIEKVEVTVEKDLRRKSERDTEKDVKKESQTVAKDAKRKVEKTEPVAEKEIKTKCDKTEIIDKDLKKKTDKNVSLEKDFKKKPDKLEAATEKDLKNKLDKSEACTKKKSDKHEVVLKRDVEKKPNKPDNNTPEKNFKKKLEKPEVVAEKDPKKNPETSSEKDTKKKADEKLEKTTIEKETKMESEKLDITTDKDLKKTPETSTEKLVKKKNEPEKELKKKPDKLEAVLEKETKCKPDISEKEKKPETGEKDLKKSETVPEKEVKKKSDKPQACEKDSKKKPDKPEVATVEEPRVSQRPSRKTKEAAAIYMEILGHKLVSEGDMDDDSISIDSFPELPNVRKTEQRENELKARVKSKNIENSTDAASKAKCEDKIVPKAKAKKVDKVETTSSEAIKEGAKNLKADENVTSEVVKNIKELDKSVEETTVLQKLPKQDPPKNKKSEIFSDSDSSVKKLKILKKADITPKPKPQLVVEPPKKTTILIKPETVEPAKKINLVKPEVVEPAEKTINPVKPETIEAAIKLNPMKPEVIEPTTKIKLVRSETFETTKKTVNPLMPETIEPLKKTPEIVDAVKRVTRCSNKSIIDISFSESEDSFTHEQVSKERQKVVYPKRLALAKSSSSSAVPAKLKRDSRNSIKTRSRKPEQSESESDESTTSKTSKMPSKTKSKKIKLVKTSAAAQKPDNSFSDSDEEPLSKLTLIKPKIEENKNKNLSTENLALETVAESPVKSPKSVLKRKSMEVPVVSDVKKCSLDAKKEAKREEKPDEQPALGLSGKPKRECTKRPQNYLPLFSSSEDEDKYFHGFMKTENAKQTKSAKTQESKCPPTPSADLLCKDVDKRFGKGKVNMSTEQIEKWLKESAMAGSVVKKESDDILKYEEKPTQEISLPVSVGDAKVPEKVESPVKVEVKAELPVKPAEIVAAVLIPKSVDLEKPPQNPKPTERKMIFRKERKIPTPSANAFSPNNESSVYAFEADNEDAISTPFRRPARRPSSTATSRSEDSSKYEESSKTAGKFRLPSLIKQDIVKSTHKQEVSLMLSTDESNNSASIAVQLDINTENSVQADAEDGEQLFYIPLQPGKQSSSQLIQGVAVKLGTTGANGPNQRVVMSAKLVTHTPAGAQKLEKPLATSTPMYPPATTVQKAKNVDNKTFIKGKTCDRLSENSEDLKYKVPSSPSASSSSSTKVTKRQYIKSRMRPLEFCNPITASEFPSTQSSAMILEAPIFHPNEKEFQDPLEYIEKIRSRAEKFGICRIVPPSNFKPECKVADDMRFTAYNQYVHKMLHRWGPNFKELMAITKYLETQNIALAHPPWIGGMEIDLPRLYQIVQSLGGLKEVIEKKKWPKVSELMKIPRSAQDRVTKLDDIYCKYLLPYDTLSPAEREKLFDEVETEWAKRESRALLRSQQKIANRDTSPTSSESDSNDEAEECIVKGRNMALNAFYRIARNTMSMWFKTVEPTAQDVEQEFWKHVTVKQNHICVHSGSIDSGSWGYGFAVSKHSPFARHAWNLKVLTNNSGSVLRSMGPVMGVTVPTLHVGMVFSACCWYRDPHSLPWIEYLHTGGNKIWYGIPDSMSEVFHSTLVKLVPNYCRNKSLWLPSDTAMIPPSLLVENGVSLSRTIQEPGQFIVVFPKAFTSSICTGYVVSESVYFAPLTWLNNAQSLFDELQNNCEPSMFSFQKLLVSIASDIRSSVDVLKQVIPAIELLREKEKCGWKKLEQLGLVNKEKLPIPDALLKKKKRLQDDSGDYECEVCCRNLFISWIIESQEDAIYCLDHATEYVEKKKIEVSNCKLVYTYDDQELANLIEKMKNAIEAKLQKKAASKSAGPS